MPNMLKVIARGRAGHPFFQVLIIEANNLLDAGEKAGRFLARCGASFEGIEEDDIETVEIEAVLPSIRLPEKTPEGVVAATGRMYYGRPKVESE